MATFGNTNAGASGTNLATAAPQSQRIGTMATLTENGIATSISVYLGGVTETLDVTAFLNYGDNEKSAFVEVVSLERLDLSVTAADAWYTFDIADTSIVAGRYLLSVAGDGTDLAAGACAIRYDFNTAGTSTYLQANVGTYAGLKTNPLVFSLILGSLNACIYCTYTALPTVTISAVTNNAPTTATANGNITTIPGGNCTLRGFVYGTTPKAQPNNAAGASSGYDTVVSESGSYGTGTYSLNLTGLTSGTKYYMRPYAQDTNGYSYGDELSFTTPINGAWLKA